uniref:Uncharacterized protein n=1 Tax=Timspurckia oligopyrenoides TaxID=708627 RepID=A0A7S0ZGG8_9RHOD
MAASDEAFVFTTRSHSLCCMSLHVNSEQLMNERELLLPISLNQLWSLRENSEQLNGKIQKYFQSAPHVRPIDRSSRLICAVSKGDVCVILEAPRGNFETVVPRSLATERVIRLIQNERAYGEAFRLARAQRLDPQLIVNANGHSRFVNDGDAALLVRSVLQMSSHDTIIQSNLVSQLNVFITLYAEQNGLNVDVTRSVLNSFIDAIDQVSHELNTAQNEVANLVLLEPILSALCLQKPALFENALRRIETLNDSDQLAHAVDYLLILCQDESDRVYREALALYNLQLASLVAAQNQRDPKETRDQLGTWAEMSSEARRRFEIDLFLGHYSSALNHLVEDASTVNESTGITNECVEFALQHKLFLQALTKFEGDSNAIRRVRDAYAHELLAQGDAYAAGSLWMSVESFTRASDAFRDGGFWQLALHSRRMCEEEMRDGSAWNGFVESTANVLYEYGRFVECARVRVEYLNDSEGALSAILEGKAWKDAVELCTRFGFDAKVRILPSVMEYACEQSESLEETCTKVKERQNRLEQLLEVKRLMNERLARKQENGEEESQSDVFSESTASSTASGGASSVASDFTFVSRTSYTSLYGSAKSTAPGGSKSSTSTYHQRKSQKQKKKRIKQGHPDEEKYLCEYLRNVIPKDELLMSTKEVLEMLLYFNQEKLSIRLQNAMNSLLNQLKQSPQDIMLFSVSSNISPSLPPTWSISLIDHFASTSATLN